MSNSMDNNKELDSYGVWVKRPPQDADESIQDSDTLPDFSDFDIGKDLNSAPEIKDDSFPETENAAISEDEFNQISDEFVSEDFSTIDTPSEENSSENEEVSFDDFISESASDDGEISLDDFMDTSDSSDGEISLDDFLDDSSSSETKEDDVTNDEALDIDVDFKKSTEDEVPTVENGTDDDYYDENDDMFEVLPEQESKPQFQQNQLDQVTQSNTGMEEISLDDFDIGDSDDATAAAAGAAINAAAEGEDVDLSEFGTDENPAKERKNTVIDYDLAITEEDEVAEAPSVSEIKTSTERANENMAENTLVDNSLLKQIVADLSGLKDEINSLKNDFAQLKSKEHIEESSDGLAQENPISTFAAITECTETAPSEDSGFFNNSDEDDTITLSGDELSNIMNTADFSTEESPVNDSASIDEDAAQAQEESFDTDTTETEEDFTEPSENIEEETESFAAETEMTENVFTDENPFGNLPEENSIPEDIVSDSPLSMEVENEKLEEPDIDSFENNEFVTEEISIPKVDEIAIEERPVEDILVESSSTDLMESVTESSETMMETDFEVQTDIDESLSDTDEIISEESVTSIDNSFETQVDDDQTISDIGMTATEEDTDTSDSLETIFEEEPTVAEGLSDDNFDYLKEDSVDKEEPPVAAFTDMSETREEIAPVETEPSNTAIPTDLKSDIKSVLLYMDQLLENLPEEKILEFAKSEQFVTYKKLFSELGLS